MSRIKTFTTQRFLSAGTDFGHFPIETLLRKLAQSIPAAPDEMSENALQILVNVSVEALHKYLMQAITAIGAAVPVLPRMAVVSTSGCDVQRHLLRLSGKAAMPPYPVSGFLTFGRQEPQPIYGSIPHEPAIELAVRRCGLALPLFAVEFSVSSEDDIRRLGRLMYESPALWAQFEKLYGISVSSDLPLPDHVRLPKKAIGADYVQAFIRHCVDILSPDDFPERLVVTFKTDGKLPLLTVLTGAASLLIAQPLTPEAGLSYLQDAIHFAERTRTAMLMSPPRAAEYSTATDD